MTTHVKKPSDVLDFWFKDTEPKQWWTKDAEFDHLIKSRVVVLYIKATQCELYEWRQSAQGRLAEIIVLDQFSRNMYRDDARAFQFDSLAVSLVQTAIEVGADKELLRMPKHLSFMYMPLMHSESLKIHELAVEVFSQPGLEDNLQFEYKHKAIIERFGRYPHRNEVLGRVTTDEEAIFLQQPGSSF